MDGIHTQTLVITPETLKRIAEIDEFKGAWAALGRISPERLTGLRRVASIESAGASTRIEGARLDDRQVERLLSNLAIERFDSRDEEEVAGYAVVMETVFASRQEIALTENIIKQRHRDLLQYSTKDQRHRGEYKTHDNHVEAFAPDGNGRLSRDLPELSVQILELCREHGRITVAEATRATGANRNTVKDHLKALTRAEHIVRHGAGRGSWYGHA